MKNCIFTIVLVGYLTSAWCQERPKVGLVLSGGSAHGIAHIGVLQYLDRHNIPIDYITGTSMGSIIGALYATGLAPEEIERITAEQNWNELLATDVPLDEVAPSEKDYHNRFLVTLEAKNGKLGLPQGFLNTQKLDVQLNQMFRSAHRIDDFDDLPFPFKCVAVDIETGDIVILDDGYIGHAVRASMAIPSVFTPIERDGRLLVDGGLRRNFPVEEVIAMGADIVIGAYVGSELEPKEDLNSLVDILGQSAFMMGILDSKEQEKLVDILIKPDVKDLPSFGFDLYEDLIDEGFRATAAQSSAFDSLKTIFAPYNYIKPRGLPIPKAASVGSTKFPELRSPFKELAEFKYGNGFRIKSGSTKFDDIATGVSRIFGTKHFDNINYTFENVEGGRRNLKIAAEPREVNTFSIGLNYMPSSATSFILNSELRNKLAKPSVLYTTARISENWGGKLDFKYRLGNQKNFLLTLKGQGQRYDQKMYRGERLLAQFKEVHSYGRIGLGYEPNNRLLLNGFIGIENFFVKPDVIDDRNLSRYKRWDATIGLEAKYQSLDDIYLSTQGYDIVVSTGYNYKLTENTAVGMGNEINVPPGSSFIFADVKADLYLPLFSKVILQLEGSLGYKSSTSFVNNYRVGGLEDRDTRSIAAIGLNTHQVHYSRYGMAGASIRWNAIGSIFLSLHGNFINGMAAFTRTDSPRMNRWESFSTAGMKLSLKSPIGPIQVGYGWNELTEQWNTNFSFGYTFF